jgi:hypothetical protein
MACFNWEMSIQRHWHVGQEKGCHNMSTQKSIFHIVAGAALLCHACYATLQCMCWFFVSHVKGKDSIADEEDSLPIYVLPTLDEVLTV